MAGAWRLVARLGPRVEKTRHDSIEEAISALDARIAAADGQPVAVVESPLGRTYEPAARVTGRLEVRGPGGARGGVDVRGDGVAQAWTGRFRRRLVEPRPGEDAYAALRRALGG